MVMTNIEGATVLVTGASSGIGKSFAWGFAKRGAGLILVARSQDKLDSIAMELNETYRIPVHVFAIDLASPDAAQRLCERIKAEGLVVDILVNNAGFGKWTHFLDEKLATYKQMIALNINALVELTHLCLPEMLARGRGGVINVASTAAFQPVPYFAVYSATKAFVLSFTEALAGEYGKCDIRILALCPGATDTNFSRVANANMADMSSATPDEVAEAGIAAFMDGKSSRIHGLKNYLISLLPRILPRSAVIWIAEATFRNKMAPTSS